MKYVNSGIMMIGAAAIRAASKAAEDVPVQAETTTPVRFYLVI